MTHRDTLRTPIAALQKAYSTTSSPIAGSRLTPIGQLEKRILSAPPARASMI